MSFKISYVAELKNVAEVTLIGTADLDYWQTILARANLQPRAVNGQAEMFISCARGKFWGCEFTEWSCSVAVEFTTGAERKEGYYLVAAYNSSAWFAWCERTFFGTPYQSATCVLQQDASHGQNVGTPAGQLWHARWVPDHGILPIARQPANSGEDGWAGPIFLPASKAGEQPGQTVFFARLWGQTETYPFLSEQDELVYTPQPGTVFEQLRLSNFLAREWHLRRAAEHSRSATWRRDRAFPPPAK
ncbi:MAG: hypothetical protein SFX18_01365 [Pirellulales bacterium]|nr:hypothetical protein [Pirellulales bacterium]